jgi:hydrogenase nickel incorporation protein HypA/HybF
MHELSIAQSIVDSAREQAAAHGGRRVLRIGVRVGDLSGVAGDALQFCFGMTVKDTDLDGATLELEAVPVLYRCAACAHEFRPVEFLARCPACGGDGAAMIAGDELGLSFLELE